MFEDENEKKVNSPEGFTDQNNETGLPAWPQTSPTEPSAPNGSESTQNYGFTPEPEVPEATVPDFNVPDQSKAQPQEQSTPYTPDYTNTGYTAPQEPAGSYNPHDQINDSAYQQQAQTRNYAENPYSPYSDRQYSDSKTSYGAPQTPAFNPAVNENGKNKKPKKSPGMVIIAIVAILLVFVIGFCSATIIFKNGFTNLFKDKNSQSTTSSSAVAKGDGTKLEIATTPSSEVSTTAQIAEKGRASNVGILIYSSSSSTSASGEGSGIVMGLDSTGEYTYIITCAHVIDTSGVTIKVQTEDGTSYDAEKIGFDTRTDIGVIRVHATGFTAAEFGDSDELSVGDPVYAIGNPGGVEFFGTFTAGYVSAINRPISSEIGYTMKCIQHDAAINPGNSGGMLVNKYGQVIGINSQKITSTSYEGMGFAIPITDAKPIIDDLITYGYVPDRAKLGITYAPVTSYTQYAIIAQANNLPAGTLVIASISTDSAFADTDVRVGDMITAVNGNELDTADVLLEAIDTAKVGDEMTLTIARMNSNYKVETFEVTVKLVEDKGNTVEEQTTQQSYNPYSYFGY